MSIQHDTNTRKTSQIKINRWINSHMKCVHVYIEAEIHGVHVLFNSLSTLFYWYAHAHARQPLTLSNSFILLFRMCFVSLSKRIVWWCFISNFHTIYWHIYKWPAHRTKHWYTCCVDIRTRSRSHDRYINQLLILNKEILN